MLDNPALTQVQGIATLTASVMRMEMEAAANPSLRHTLGAAGKLLGDKGLTEREVAPGRFPPGAFKRDRAPFITDKEPRNRISWMTSMLPYMGHQNLFNKIQFLCFSQGLLSQLGCCFALWIIKLRDCH